MVISDVCVRCLQLQREISWSELARVMEKHRDFDGSLSQFIKLRGISVEDKLRIAIAALASKREKDVLRVLVLDTAIRTQNRIHADCADMCSHDNIVLIQSAAQSCYMSASKAERVRILKSLEYLVS